MGEVNRECQAVVDQQIKVMEVWAIVSVTIVASVVKALEWRALHSVHCALHAVSCRRHFFCTCPMSMFTRGGAVTLENVKVSALDLQEEMCYCMHGNTVSVNYFQIRN